MTSHYPNHVWEGWYACSDAWQQRHLWFRGTVNEAMTEKNLSETYGVEVNIYSAESGNNKMHFCDPNLE